MILDKIKAISANAAEMREDRSDIQKEFQEENTIQTFSRQSLLKMLSHAKKVMSETKLTAIMNDMESKGYHFNRRGGGVTSPYALTFDDIYDIANELKVPTHREQKRKAFVGFMSNLKGGVGKSLSTNMAATGAIMLEDFLLKQLRILIIDLDHQASSTETCIPSLRLNESDYTSINAMADNLSREDLLKFAVKKTSTPNLSLIPCGTFDGFVTEQLDSDDIRGELKSYELLQKRIIEPLQYDFDIILLDVGPHLDIVLKNALCAANGIFVPVPPTFYNFDSTMRFLEKLYETIGRMVEEGFDPDNLKFIKGFVTKDASHLNSRTVKHNSMLVTTLEDDLKEIFGRNDVIASPLRQEEAYERCIESGATIFSMKKSEYTGSAEAFTRAHTHAAYWAKEVIKEMLDYQKEL